MSQQRNSQAMRRRFKAYTSAAGAFVAAVAVGMGFGSVFTGSAIANPDSGVVNESEVVEGTPSSLRATVGAADTARFRAYEEEYTGEVFTCDAPTGATSLASAFYIEGDSVAMPTQAGTTRFASPFGYRSDPFNGTSTMHKGVDWSGPVGTPIYSVADGTVVYVGTGREVARTQNVVVIEHEVNGEVFTSWYIHMYLDGIFVTEGQQVSVGEHIANIGNAGRSTGPHLHFEIHPGSFPGFPITDAVDNPVDPISFLAGLGARDVTNLCG
ncbi:MAG: M23 family metallopeptidase [Actinomycetaceae bacterium]|nr:M23 family metallopeptidase [Actinomycetaceae bacterium]